MKKTESAGGVVKNKEGKVLVISQHGTSWSLPKGHIEAGLLTHPKDKEFFLKILPVI